MLPQLLAIQQEHPPKDRCFMHLSFSLSTEWPWLHSSLLSLLSCAAFVLYFLPLFCSPFSLKPGVTCCPGCPLPPSPWWLFQMSSVPQPHETSLFSFESAVFLPARPPLAYPFLLFINILFFHVLIKTKIYTYTCIYSLTQSHCCTPETNTTLLINYVPI